MFILLPSLTPHGFEQPRRFLSLFFCHCLLSPTIEFAIAMQFCVAM